MSRVGARREREGTVPRATAVPRLAKPARHAGYAPGAHRSIGGCRRSGEAASLRRAGQAWHRGVGGAGVPRLSRRAFAGRDMRRARVTERSTLASGPDPRCISGRPPRRPPFGRRRRPTVGPDSAPSSSPGGHARPPLRARQDRRAAPSGVGRHFGCCAAFAPMAWVEAWYGRLDPLEGRGMPHAEAVQWTEERTPAPASAHRRMVVRQLPRFALCWLGIAGSWPASLVVESLISPRDALLALARVAAVAFAAVALCRAHPEAPRVIPIVVVASVLLGVAGTAR